MDYFVWLTTTKFLSGADKTLQILKKNEQLLQVSPSEGLILKNIKKDIFLPAFHRS